jgi:hypothetical protein
VALALSVPQLQARAGAAGPPTGIGIAISPVSIARQGDYMVLLLLWLLGVPLSVIVILWLLGILS